MKRQFKIVVLLFSFLTGSLFFTACEKEFQLDNNQGERLVLLSSFTPDSLFSVTVSTSFPIGGDTTIQNSNYPENVTIQLFEDDIQVADFNFIDNDLGLAPFYRSDFRPKEDAEYFIQALLDGFPIATATNRVPSPVSIEQINTISIDSFLSYYYYYYDLTSYDITATLNIPESNRSAKYFHLKAWRNLTDPYFGYAYFKEDLTINLSSSVEQTQILHESGSLFEGDVFVNHPNGIEFSLGFTYDPFNEVRAPIYLELRHVSEEYFLFHKSIGQQEVTSFQSGLLANQSVLIYNNIENGVGNFGGYSVAIDSIIW